MKILIGCETSGTVRNAFLDKGLAEAMANQWGAVL